MNAPPDAARPARLARRRHAATVAVVVLATVSLLWLVALADPQGDTILGVGVLEVLTLVPLALVVRYRRRVGARLRLEPGDERRPRPDPPPVPVARPLRFDATREPDLVLRPRTPLLAIGLALGIAFVVLLLWLSYDAAFFDPRIVVFALFVVFAGAAGMRARVLVAGGVLWRRTFRGYAGVDLRALDRIEFGRSRFLRREGWVRTILRVTDREGRRLALKPVLWKGGAGALLAGLAGVARVQGLALDERTAARLRRAAERSPDGPRAWAFRLSPSTTPVPGAGALGAWAGEPAASSFWTRRDDNGVPRRAQPQRLVPVLAILALTVPVMLVVGRAGTSQMRSLRCRNDRSRWAEPITDPPITDAALIASRLAPSHLEPGEGRAYTLGPGDIANGHNTAAVQRDARRLVEGTLVQWTDGGRVRAEVYVERFARGTDALTYHRDYAEDHCHRGDRSFAVAAIPGAVGFRCGCRRSSYDDRVSVVRGAVRVQAVVYGLRGREGHGAATALARAALQTAAYGNAVPGIAS